MVFCLSTGPEAMEQAEHGQKYLKPFTKTSLSFFKLFTSGVLLP
jgi:hypothetical protein